MGATTNMGAEITLGNVSALPARLKRQLSGVGGAAAHQIGSISRSLAMAVCDEEMTPRLNEPIQFHPNSIAHVLSFLFLT